MEEFSSSSESLLDKSGRVNISAKYLEIFKCENFDVVLYCKDDGCLAIYPKSKWFNVSEKIKSKLDEDLIEDRNMLRRLLGLSEHMQISNQGRLRIPVPFRYKCHLKTDAKVMLSAGEDCLEIWDIKYWQKIMGIEELGL